MMAQEYEGSLATVGEELDKACVAMFEAQPADKLEFLAQYFAKLSDECEGGAEQKTEALPAVISAMVSTDYTGYAEVDESTLTFVVDAPIPECGPNDVLIKVLASSVNPIDWKILSGALKDFMPRTFPHTPGFECCGVAVRVGADVQGIKQGDAVWSDSTQGCYAQYVAVPQEKVGLAPTNLAPQEAAVVTLAGLTSLQALEVIGAKEGSKVLILGGSGGTGHMAVMIAKSKGCHVTTTCSTKNVDFLKSIGADVVINYREAQWWEEAKEMDGVYDCVGEKDVCEHAQAVLKEGGRFVTIAAMDVRAFQFKKDITGSFILTNSSTRTDLDTLKALCESGQIKPKVHKSFPLADIWGAFKESKTGRVVGKIAISVEH